MSRRLRVVVGDVAVGLVVFLVAQSVIALGLALTGRPESVEVIVPGAVFVVLLVHTRRVERRAFLEADE